MKWKMRNDLLDQHRTLSPKFKMLHTLPYSLVGMPWLCYGSVQQKCPIHGTFFARVDCSKKQYRVWAPLELSTWNLLQILIYIGFTWRSEATSSVVQSFRLVAICHTAQATMDVLCQKFESKVISRSGNVNWPLRSFNITRLHYFLRGSFHTSHTSEMQMIEGMLILSKNSLL